MITILNRDNKTRVFQDEKNPLDTLKLSSNGCFTCRRPVGEGYYSKKNNSSYVSWNEGGLDIYYAVYSHDNSKWSNPILVAKLGLYGRWDYHDYVTMVEGKNSKPIFFYNIHSSHTNMIFENEKGEWESKVVSDNQNAYPSPVRYGDTIYVFYSENKEIEYPYRPLCYIKSEDLGGTWSSPKTVVDSEKKTPEHHDEVYQCGCEFAPAIGTLPDRIILTWTMWGGPRHAAEGKGAFCAVFHLDDEKLYDANGTLLGDCVTHDLMRNHCLIEEFPIDLIERQNVSCVVAQPDKNGNPIVAYGSFNDGKYTLSSAKKVDKKWEIDVFSNDTFNLGDMLSDDNGLSVCAMEGDSVLIYRMEYGEKSFALSSITHITHENGSDSFPYLNFIGNTNKLLLSTFSKDEIEEYYTGKYPIYILN